MEYFPKVFRTAFLQDTYEQQFLIFNTFWICEKPSAYLTKLLTLSAVFSVNFEKYNIAVDLFPDDFVACFSILIIDFEHVFSNWKYFVGILFCQMIVHLFSI